MAAFGSPFCRGVFFCRGIENHVEDHHINVEQRLGIAGYCIPATAHDYVNGYVNGNVKGKLK